LAQQEFPSGTSRLLDFQAWDSPFCKITTLSPFADIAGRNVLTEQRQLAETSDAEPKP
jgi:hypothetical protein